MATIGGSVPGLRNCVRYICTHEGGHCFCLPVNRRAWLDREPVDMEFACCWCNISEEFRARKQEVIGHGPGRFYVEWVLA